MLGYLRKRRTERLAADAVRRAIASGPFLAMEARGESASELRAAEAEWSRGAAEAVRYFVPPIVPADAWRAAYETEAQAVRDAAEAARRMRALDAAEAERAASALRSAEAREATAYRLDYAEALLGTVRAHAAEVTAEAVRMRSALECCGCVDCSDCDCHAFRETVHVPAMRGAVTE